MAVDRDLAERFAHALGHFPGPWEERHMFMDDLFVADDESTRHLPALPVMACTRCGAQLPDDEMLARRSLMLADWCPWLMILTPERRAAAASYYRSWCRSLGEEPGAWAGDDGPIPSLDRTSS